MFSVIISLYSYNIFMLNILLYTSKTISATPTPPNPIPTFTLTPPNPIPSLTPTHSEHLNNVRFMQRNGLVPSLLRAIRSPRMSEQSLTMATSVLCVLLHYTYAPTMLRLVILLASVVILTVYGYQDKYHISS